MSRASVAVSGVTISEIGKGLLVLVGVTHDDVAADARALAAKIADLRIFRDDAGLMNRSVIDVGGGVLVVSQFTLYGDVRKGRRPSFVDAATPEWAEPLVEQVIDGIRHRGIPVHAGRFRASMEVELVNDGPVTLLVETRGGKVV